MLTLPFKNFTPDDITQVFHKDHKAIDVVENSTTRLYGTPLCAVEDALVLKIFTEKLDDRSHGLEQGYGIKIKGLETGHTYTYWHTLPYMPVWGGDRVKRGQIIAYMGNSGTVFQGGVPVPIKDRLHTPFPGTHLHLVDYDENGKQVNIVPRLNWNWQPQYTAIDQVKAMSVVFGKMAKDLKEYKGRKE